MVSMALDGNLKELLNDTSRLFEAIESDPQFKVSNTTDSKPDEAKIEEVLEADSELTKELARLNQLKILSDLIKEFNTNYEFNELENCYYSLQNLHKKLQEVNISGESFMFQQSVARYVDDLHLKLLNRLREFLSKFWSFSQEEVSFRKTIEIDSNLLQFDELINMFENTFLNQKTIDQSNWFIASTNLDSSKEQEITVLQDILDEYVKLNPLISMLKRFAFGEDCTLLVPDDKTLRLKAEKCSPLKRVQSYELLVDFIRNDLSKHSLESIMTQFGNILLLELLKIIRKNPELLSNDKEATTEVLSNIHEGLKNIANDSNWFYDESDLNRILKDENIYTVLKVESMMQNLILKIRSIPDENYNKLIKVPVNSGSNEHSNTDSKKKASDEDEWEWDDDKENEEPDGWAEELDLDIDDIPLEVSAFTETAIEIFESYENECNEIGRAKLESIYNYKFNLLQTSFFAMATSKVDDWTQLFKDMKYITNGNPRLTQLVELSTRNVEINLNFIKKKIYKIICDQLKQLREHERNPDWSITLSQLLPYIEDSALPTLYKLEDNNITASIVAFIVHDIVIDQILNWNVISEQSSENLSEFIKLLLGSLQIPRLNLIDVYRHSREKLDAVSKILTAHLKDILEMLYEGEFFLFETDEIVQWIVLLFADTPSRRDCINEIRKVREEADTE